MPFTRLVGAPCSPNEECGFWPSWARHVTDQIHNSVRTSSRKGSLVVDEDLRETVQRALLEIGKDDMEKLMDVIYKLRSDVHITTALQLCRILTHYIRGATNLANLSLAQLGHHVTWPTWPSCHLKGSVRT
mmetsp:Transcript_65105/g.178656  ORF Transcript_65105/g.178656 Transcript_65105/m.178656 type:complete len:131 (+) Transcript_65105:62-454(+)